MKLSIYDQIVKMREVLGITHTSAQSLYYIAKRLDKDRLKAGLAGDVGALQYLEHKHNYYGKAVQERNAIEGDIKETLDDLGLLLWAFKKIGSRDRIKAAVKTGLELLDRGKT